MSFPGEFLAGQAFITLYVFIAGLGDDFVRQGRGRAVLVPAGGVEPVADELLVERWLGPAGLVLVRGPVAGAVGSQDLVGQQQFTIVGIAAELKLGVGENQALPT